MSDTLLQQLKKLLKVKLKLNFNKIKVPRKQNDWVYICFRSEEDREEALKTISGMTWKNNILRATVRMYFLHLICLYRFGIFIRTE